MKDLSKEGSNGDRGNAILVGNTNALKSPVDPYKSVNEFFDVETDAMIVSLFLIEQKKNQSMTTI